MPNPPNHTTPVLSVKQLVTHIGDKDTIIKGVSFDIHAGETFALVGESGSGKSMSALSIMRLLPAAVRIQSGEVHFNGNNLFKLTEAQMRSVRGKGIGIIFQEPMTSLNPVMSIGEQITEAIVNAKPTLSKNSLKHKTLELLDLVGIKDPEQRIHEYPHQFSGGMRQRVMIAIALAGDPELLIADEPTTALDVTIQAQVLRLIKDIQQKRNMAVLLITHDLGVVHQMADRVAVMRHGEILETASSDSFFKQPQHAYSKALFDAVPNLAKRGQKLRVIDQADTEHPQEDKPLSATHCTPEHADTPTILAIEQLKTYFPIKKGLLRRTVDHVKAVDDVCLELKQGKTLALVGESGSGKTTLAKTILQLLNSTQGKILFNGQDLNQINRQQQQAIRAQLQIVFQDPYSSMNPRMLVRDILSEGMIALGVEPDTQTREQRLLELLTLVGLEKDSLNRYPHQFSGGQRQRIAIARALAVNPKLIICDEPTSALDVSVQAQILNLLKDLQNTLGLSYLFITHDLSVVSYIADDIAVMLNGKIVEQGSTENIILNPQHPYTQQLMSAVPELYKER